jgi:amidase
MTGSDLFFAGVAGQAEAVRSGRITAVELVTATLERIQRLDGGLNAFTVVAAERALTEAESRDSQTRDRGPLHGVPIAVKEEVDVEGEVTTFGGRANHAPAEADSPIVHRLREAGAVIVGKTNMPEFGQWPFTESVAHGITRNPWNQEHSPLGSSGGTAAAVAAGLVPAAIGGDGGGSIRLPASACGLFGLKPQRGRVTAAPASHRWLALGTIGPLTRSVMDSAIIYDVIRGAVPSDRFPARDVGSFVAAAQAEPKRLRVAVTVKAAMLGVKPHPEHVRAVHETAELLASLGHQVEEIDPSFPDTTTTFIPQYIHGIRDEAAHLQRPEHIELRTRNVLRAGAAVTPRVAEWAVRRGEQVSARANRVFETHDLLLTPVTPHRPPRVGVLDGAGMLRASWRSLPVTAYTALWNVAGNPAASVPAGFATDGMPLAVQLVAAPDDEATILSVSVQLERLRPWAHATPPL